MTKVIGFSSGIARALDKAWKEWNNEPITGSKYLVFDDLAMEHYGIRLLYEWKRTKSYTGYEIIDNDQFALFLLKYS